MVMINKVGPMMMMMKSAAAPAPAPAANNLPGQLRTMATKIVNPALAPKAAPAAPAWSPKKVSPTASVKPTSNLAAKLGPVIAALPPKVAAKPPAKNSIAAKRAAVLARSQAAAKARKKKHGRIRVR